MAPFINSAPTGAVFLLTLEIDFDLIDHVMKEQLSQKYKNNCGYNFS